MRRDVQPITMSEALEKTLASSAADRLKEKARLVNQLDRVISEYPLEDSSNDQKDWLGLEDTEKVRDLEKTIEALHKRYGKNVVLMDETSIGVVDDLIEGRGALTPLGLVDLSTFVTNFVLRDRVIRTERLEPHGSTTHLGKAPGLIQSPFSVVSPTRCGNPL